MQAKIAQNRLENILQRDKITDPDRVCEILKGELQSVIEAYINLAQPISVRFHKEGERMLFNVEIEASRVKSFGYLPYL